MLVNEFSYASNDNENLQAVQSHSLLRAYV